MKPLNILIVEDGKTQRTLLRDFLGEAGYRIVEAEKGENAISRVQADYFDLVLLDYKLPGMDGMEVLQQIKLINPEIDVIMMTAYGTVETAVKAMKLGAVDYITKPVELDELLLVIERISEHRNLVRENEILRKELRARDVTADHIIFQSKVMNHVVNLAGRVAGSNATVLIRGESGTGKELIARLIHTLSPRSGKPLITVNCAALPENLLESELFGHEKGAFTGAHQRRIGRFEEAEGGTLFLDEIGDMSPGLQVKLLRFLQEREFQRLGGNQTIHTDVRIISATNRDLEERVREGLFRDDLYYRLNVVSIEIPPLRERKEDIPLLMDHFLKKFANELGDHPPGLSMEARDMLLKYDYPGNVRELENIIERAVVIRRGDIITTSDLPFPASPQPPAAEKETEQTPWKPLKKSVEELEKDMIKRALETTNNHQTRAAKMLGISERMLRYKLKKYGLK
ncbi:MAG: sigma-54-dependent Fis family transcriptional regulator [Deltaproteobacteria bacterium]|nr:sigma-54-dependent Fis family transcriptional regulator [Deltaproteobacteria bacterium]